MNPTDLIYVALHLALTVLVCVRHEQVEHWPLYVAWNLCAMVAVVLLARKRHSGPAWEFAHDWLPAIFFVTMFEEVSFLSLSLQSGWQNASLIRLEATLFATPPATWMHAHAAPWLPEFVAFGYFTFYFLYPIVGGMFWAWRHRPRFAGAFRSFTYALSVGYLVCYATYLFFPTQSPANLLGVQQISSAHGGAFPSLVHLIQGHGGVHGNAFPSAHIMLAFVVLVFAYRFLPRAAPWLLAPVLLMCAGAVYDGYHYASDVVAGAVLGIVVGLVQIRIQRKSGASG